MTEQEVTQLGLPEIVEAERKLTMISQDRQVRVDYERRRMAHHDAVSQRRESWLEEGKRPGLDEGKRLGLDEGKRLGQQVLVNALVSVLTARGFSLSDGQRVRLDAEMDLERLKDWITRAALASTVEAVLNG